MKASKPITPPWAAMKSRMCSATRAACARSAALSDGRVETDAAEVIECIDAERSAKSNGQDGADHGRREARRRRDRTRNARRGRQPRHPLPQVQRRGRSAGRRIQWSAAELCRHRAGRSAGRGAAADAGGIRGEKLRLAGRAHQQCVDFLPDAGGRNHPRGLRRSDRHESQGAAVPVTGRCACAAQIRRTDTQHRRHPCAAPAAQLHRLLHGQGGAAHADALTGQGAGPRGARQRHLARTGAVARGSAATPASARRSSSAPSSSAWERRRTSRARRCSSRPTRPSSPARCWPSTAAAASPGEKKRAAGLQRPECAKRQSTFEHQTIRTCSALLWHSARPGLARAMAGCRNGCASGCPRP